MRRSPAPIILAALAACAAPPVAPVELVPAEPPESKPYCGSTAPVALLELGPREYAEVFPAGERLVFVITREGAGETELVSADACGQERRSLLKGSHAVRALPSGIVLACADDTGGVYWLEPPGGGAPRLLFEDVTCGDVQETPSTFLAVRRGAWTTPRPLLSRGKQDAGAVVEVHPAILPPYHPRSDGELLVLTGARELGRLEPSTRALTVLERGVHQVSPSSSGRWAAAVLGNGEVRLVDVENGGATQTLASVRPPTAGLPFHEVAWTSDDVHLGVFGDDGPLRELRRVPGGEALTLPPHGSAYFVGDDVLFAGLRRCVGCGDWVNDWWLWDPKTDASVPLAEGVRMGSNVTAQNGVLWVADVDSKTQEGPLELIPLADPAARRRYAQVGHPAVELSGGMVVGVVERTRQPGTEGWKSAAATLGRLEAARPEGSPRVLATDVRAYPPPTKVGEALVYQTVDVPGGRSVLWARGP